MKNPLRPFTIKLGLFRVFIVPLNCVGVSWICPVVTTAFVAPEPGVIPVASTKRVWPRTTSLSELKLVPEGAVAPPIIPNIVLVAGFTVIICPFEMPLAAGATLFTIRLMLPVEVFLEITVPLIP